MSSYDSDTAFPVASDNEYGLSKREYFIAKAMQGLCANQNFTESSSETWIATKAIEIADRTLLCIGGE